MEGVPEIYEFGEFEVDLTRAELRHRGKGVPITGQPYQLLEYLIREYPRTVKRSEVIALIWGETTTTSFGNLLARLNNTLRKNKKAPPYVRVRSGFIRLEQIPRKKIQTHDRVSTPDLAEILPTHRMLSYLWSYPLRGEAESSWAVKESAVLKGYLGTAREQPSLGVAIVTTELALAAFGESATSRLERCISWGMAHAERKPPYLMLVETRDPVTMRLVDVKHDLRHTLAFGVILARARIHYSYLEAYVQWATTLQGKDGGFPPDGAVTTSEVFTVLYAVELLHLAIQDTKLSSALRTSAEKARNRGIKWLIRHNVKGLWSSGVLAEFSWDGAVSTAWVLHRLFSTHATRVSDWHDCLENALVEMIHTASNSNTWVGTSELQRFRAEARIAAAVSRANQLDSLGLAARDAARMYLGAWRPKAESWLGGLPENEIDVGTAAFLLDALVPSEQLRVLATTVEQQTRGVH